MSNPTRDGVFFIADIAANHDGNLLRAKRLIELAAESGANAVKFQHFRAEKIVSDIGFKSLGSTLSHQSGWSKSVFEVFQLASVPWDWTEKLFNHAQDFGVEFMSTPYDLEAVSHLDPFLKRFKVGSGDITWLELLEEISGKNKQILLATGASSLGDVKSAIELIESSTPEDLGHVVMQCNTNYTNDPANLAFLNLNVLDGFKTLFPRLNLGLSDHTAGDVSVLGAIAKGATYIEKHFTDDQARVGPDHAFSMNPKSWSQMIEKAQLLTSALGDSLKKVEENELETFVIQRRCLRFSRELSLGHILRREDLEVLRPAPLGSLEPKHMLEILGKPLSKPVAKHEIVELASFI